MRLFSFSPLLLCGLLLLLATAPGRAQSGPAPTCKTTVTGTNNWVAATDGGRLGTLTAVNLSSSTVYLFLVDTNSTPGTGALPALPPLQIPAAYTGGYDFGQQGFTFTKGMAICASSTNTTLAVAAAGTFTISVSYLGKP